MALAAAGSRIRGWLVKEQHGGVTGECTRQREALLFAPRQSASGTIAQVFEADQSEKLPNSIFLFCTRDACRT